MAQVEKRIPRIEAQRDAEAFVYMIAPFCEQIEIVGSLRRGRPAVADVEYVVIPKLEEEPGPGLFGAGEPVLVNTLWRRLDGLVESGDPAFSDEELEEPIEPDDNEEFDECLAMEEPPSIEMKHGTNFLLCKALRGDPERTCWGEKQRAVWFRGMTHEIYLADADNFGSQMVIRTGPAAFSRHVVTELRRCGLKHEGGRVIDCSKAIDPVIPTPTEQALFDLIGLKYREPKDRVGVDPDHEANLR